MRQTSLDAYERLKRSGALGKLQKKVCDVLSRADGPMTDAEIAQPIMGQINSINKRVGELIQMGVLVELGTKTCSITNRVVRCTDLTGKDPVPLPKATEPRRFWLAAHEMGGGFAAREFPDKPMGFDDDKLILVREIRKK